MTTAAQLMVKVGADLTDFQQKMSQMKAGIDNVTRNMRIAGAAMTVGITVPLVAMAKQSADSASNLEESMNKVAVVFEQNAAAVQQWASSSATAFGQSKQQALEAAGTFGNLFDAMGMTAGQTVEMSTSLVELAADLASFNNIPIDEALMALRSGIVGEIEPMRRLGVAINATAVEAKALEMGLATTKKELTEADKVTARYALIMEQTANAQGDFARTADGYANSQRIMAAEMENLKALIGEQVLPIFSQIVGAVRKAVEWFSQLPEPVRSLSVKLGMMAAAIGPVVGGLGLIVPALSALLSPIGLVVAAVAGLAAAFATDFGGIRTKTAEVVAAVAPYFEELDYWLGENIPKAIEGLANFWNGTLKPALTATGQWITENVIPAMQELGRWLGENIPKAIAALSQFWTGTLKPAMQQVWQFIQSNVIPALQTIFQWFATNLPPAIQTLSNFWSNTLLPAIKDVWQWLDAHVIPVLKVVAEVLSLVVQVAVIAVADVWRNTLQPALKIVWEWLDAKVLPVLRDVADFLRNAFAPAADIAKAAVSGFGDALDWIKGVAEKVKDTLAGLRDKLLGLKVPPEFQTHSPPPFAVGMQITAENTKKATGEVAKLGDELEETGRDGRKFTDMVKEWAGGLFNQQPAAPSIGVFQQAFSTLKGYMATTPPALSSVVDPVEERQAAIQSFTDDWSSAIGSLVSAAQGALSGLAPEGFFPDMMQPGANGPFENIFRALDVAVHGDASQWASKLGLDQETAAKIVQDFQNGLITGQVQAMIDVPALTAMIQQQQVGKAMTDAFIADVAANAGSSAELVEAMIPFAGAKEAALEPVKSAAEKVSSTYTNTIKPTLDTMMDEVLEPLEGAFNRIATAVDGVIEALDRMKQALSGITIPPDLRPGSPTPFETGLWGIVDALKAVQANANLSFSASGMGSFGGLTPARQTVSAAPITITVNVNGGGPQVREQARLGVLEAARAVGIA